MNSIPIEVVGIIASMAPGLFVVCSAYAALLDNQHTKYDAMIACGYSIKVTKNYIIWFKNG